MQVTSSSCLKEKRVVVRKIPGCLLEASGEGNQGQEKASPALTLPPFLLLCTRFLLLPLRTVCCHDGKMGTACKVLSLCLLSCNHMQRLIDCPRILAQNQGIWVRHSLRFKRPQPDMEGQKGRRGSREQLGGWWQVPRDRRSLCLGQKHKGGLSELPLGALMWNVD